MLGNRVHGGGRQRRASVAVAIGYGGGWGTVGSVGRRDVIREGCRRRLAVAVGRRAIIVGYGHHGLR